MARVILRRFFKHKLAGIAIAVLAFLVLASAFAFTTPYSPTGQEPTNSFQKSNAVHWFGTDEINFIFLTRIIHETS